MTRIGGRPRQLETEDVVRAGAEIGLRDLSMNAVAARLGVSSTALYRHVDGRWGLERLVGESILAELSIDDDPSRGAVGYLLSTALQLRGFLSGHPGLTRYAQTLFPRGEGGRRLLGAASEGLVRRGYAMDAAVVINAAVAAAAIGYAATEEAQRESAEGLEEQRRDVLAGLLADERLGEAHRGLPQVDEDEYVRMWLAATVRGIVDAAPPGRTVPEIRQALLRIAEEEA